MKWKRGTFLAQKVFSFAVLTTHRHLSFGQRITQTRKLVDFLLNTWHNLAKVRVPLPELATGGTHIGLNYHRIFPEHSGAAREMRWSVSLVHSLISISVKALRTYYSQPLGIYMLVIRPCNCPQGSHNHLREADKSTDNYNTSETGEIIEGSWNWWNHDHLFCGSRRGRLRGENSWAETWRQRMRKYSSKRAYEK